MGFLAEFVSCLTLSLVKVGAQIKAGSQALCDGADSGHSRCVEQQRALPALSLQEVFSTLGELHVYWAGVLEQKLQGGSDCHDAENQQVLISYSL